MRLRTLSFEVQKWLYLGAYSARAKRSALYRLDAATRRVVWLQDLPGCGDTCFPGLWRLGADELLLVNYTSPLDDPDRAWISGQLSSQGTQLYLTKLHFVPR